MKSFPNTTRWKFKKLHRPNNSFNSLFECKLFLPMECTYGIQALEPGKLTAKQIESCRRALRRTLGKAAKIVLRPFPSVPVTSKSIASRMGKGKGVISFWVAIIRSGSILFEVSSNKSLRSYLALVKASTKLPIKTRILSLKI